MSENASREDADVSPGGEGGQTGFPDRVPDGIPGAEADPHPCGAWVKLNLSYSEVATALRAQHGIRDLWWGDAPLYRTDPFVLHPAFWRRLCDAATRIGALFDELCQLVEEDEGALGDYFQLPPFYQLMWRSAGGFWHGFARMDLFWVEGGHLRVAELNADTPSGQVEAVESARCLAPRVPHLESVNAGYADAFWQLCQSVYRARVPGGTGLRRALLLYPTDLPEDLPLIDWYRRLLEARGLEVVLGSPHNLRRDAAGRLCLFGQTIDLVIRHYKTDWWGERPRIFADEAPLPDEAPLARELSALLGAEREGKVAVVNPFGALLPQNKRALAYLWDHQHKLSPAARATLLDYVPETRRLESLPRAQLLAEKDQWVLKSDFGCEGGEVWVGAFCREDDWRACLENALEGRFVAQRFFSIVPLADGCLPNFGVYLIAGQPAGLLLRAGAAGRATGPDAQVLPVFLPASGPAGDQAVAAAPPGSDGETRAGSLDL